jgi:multimeric flavodoxin WrbA
VAISALGLNCSLKNSKSSSTSSTDKLIAEVMKALGADHEIVRVVDLNIKPGVEKDEGEGDEWPALLEKILAADILVFGSPIWLGQPSSVAKRVLERMDALLYDKDAKGRMRTFGKVAVVAIVGNEDGAHHCHADIFQALMTSALRSRLVPAHIGLGLPWDLQTMSICASHTTRPLKPAQCLLLTLRTWRSY